MIDRAYSSSVHSQFSHSVLVVRLTGEIRVTGEVEIDPIQHQRSLQQRRSYDLFQCSQSFLYNPAFCSAYLNGLRISPPIATPCVSHPTFLSALAQTFLSSGSAHSRIGIVILSYRLCSMLRHLLVVHNDLCWSFPPVGRSSSLQL